MNDATTDLTAIASQLARGAGRLAAGGRTRRSPDSAGGGGGYGTGAATQARAGLAGVRVASELSALAGAALRLSVQRARAAGCTWQQIGDLLGVSRQAAFQRFGHPADRRAGE